MLASYRTTDGDIIYLCWLGVVVAAYPTPDGESTDVVLNNGKQLTLEGRYNITGTQQSRTDAAAKRP